MVDIPSAFTYIETHGTTHHQRLAAFVLGGAFASDVIDALIDYQSDDGAWHGLLPANTDPIANSARALQLVRWISADQHPIVDRTAAYLAAAQGPDGAWDAASGDESERLLLTVSVCRMLMETGRDLSVYFGRALTYLSKAWERGAVHDAPIATMANMLPLFKIGGQPSDAAVVDGCNIALRAYVAAPNPSPDAVVTIAHAALNTRYAGNKLYIASRDCLLGMQDEDGGWRSERGATHRPDVTVDALMLLRWGGLL